MEKIQVHSRTQTTTITSQTINGIEYYKVPVIMMVEGVHSGSRGPLLHTKEELAKSVDKWKDIPVTINHPTTQDGQFISVNVDGGNNFVVGHIVNAYVENDRLKATAMINKNKVLSINPDLLRALESKKQIDVSIGVFSQEVEIAGNWKDEEYHAIATNYIPDHLAILPNDSGACSWQDGCGIRVNQSHDCGCAKNSVKPSINKNSKNMEKNEKVHLITNKAGYKEIISKLHSMLDSMDSEMSTFFLEDVFEDYYVYRVNYRNQGGEKIYKQDYTLDESEQIINSGDLIQVVRQVEYSPIQSNKDQNPGMKRTINPKKKGKVMSKNAKAITALILNTATQFTENDRDWLEELEEGQLAKISGTLENNSAQPEVTKEQALEKLQLNKLEDFLEIMPDGMKAQVNSALQLRDQRRKDMISSIQANSKDVWEEAELQSMPCATLEKIQKSLSVNKKQPVQDADYSGQGAGTSSYQNNSEEFEVEPLLPAGLDGKKN